MTVATSRRPVEQLGDDLLLARQLDVAFRRPLAVEVEHEIEARDLLLDQAPLVDAARPFEQQRLGVDRHEEVLLLGLDVALEVERPRGPREQVVDRLFDL
jgi:hypothetical protein